METNVIKRKCDCGQSKTFIFGANSKADFFICMHCRERVYKSDRIKFIYELKKAKNSLQRQEREARTI